ncbi:MAG: ATP-binding protein, partial [Candidatus Aminicenantes bacterium]|nr:ATP-binding protein [Candidatus Aminicenantes bacterium]
CSHSPYLIEAVKIYSDQSELKEKTAFYLSEAEKSTFTSRIIEITDDISPVFELMAEPFRKLETIDARDIA